MRWVLIVMVALGGCFRSGLGDDDGGACTPSEIGCFTDLGRSCTGAIDCFSGLCACADATCDAQVCAGVDCGPCGFTSAGVACDGDRAAGTPCPDDDEPSTDDLCDGAGACAHTPNSLALTDLELLAGNYNPAGHHDGVGGEVRFSAPAGMDSDGTFIYIADPGNGTIRRFTIATGEVTTIAGTPWLLGYQDGPASQVRFDYPTDVALVGGSLYICEGNQHRIRRLDLTSGDVSTYAGLVTSGFIDGPAIDAQFYYPRGLETDGTTLFVVDKYNHAIRAIDLATDLVATLAGGTEGDLDGVGAAAQFKYPRDASLEGGTLWVSDEYNFALRAVDVATATVTTATDIGDGTLPGVAAAMDHVYITNVHSIVDWDIAGASRSTLLGSRWTSGSVDGDLSVARVKLPQALELVGQTLYYLDTGNSILRAVDLGTGLSSTPAGEVGLTTGSLDGIGGAARYREINDVAIAGDFVYVADESDYTIRRITISTGESVTIAGTSGQWSPPDGDGLDARFHRPSALTVLGDALYVVDEDSYILRRIRLNDHFVDTVAGTVAVVGAADGVGLAASFDHPNAITNDGSYLYVADRGNHTIRRIDPTTFEVTTVAGVAGDSGGIDGSLADARLDDPRGLVSCDGRLYVTERDRHAIRVIDFAGDRVSTLAGSRNGGGYVDGLGPIARFRGPSGMSCDGDRLFVADGSGDTVRLVSRSTGEVSTFVGSHDIAEDTDGPLVTATTNRPLAVAFGSGVLAIANTYNVRVVR